LAAFQASGPSGFFGFNASTATALSSDELPLTPPAFVQEGSGITLGNFDGSLDSLTLVPEPSLALLLAAASALAARRR
jgi:hypothetical protein